MCRHEKTEACKPRMAGACGGVLRAALGLTFGLGLLTSSGVFAADNIWEHIGLTGRTVSALAADPRSALIIYAGTESGIFKTSDGGTYWNQVGPEGAGEIHTLAMDPLSPDTLYAGTSARGVFKTTDAGSHWTPKNNGLGTSGVAVVAIDPQAPSRLFVGTWDSGLFRSTDGGDSWDTVSSGVSGTTVLCVSFDLGDPRKIYAAFRDTGVFKSTDGGGLWQPWGLGIGDHDMRAIAIHPEAPSDMVGGVWGSGIFRSTDAGGHWRPVAAGSLALSYVASISYDPQVPSRLVACAPTGVYLSQDGGEVWEWFNNGMEGKILLTHAFHPAVPTQVLAGTSDGIYRVTLACAARCGATVASQVQTGVPSQFLATSAPLNCTGATSYTWDLGDGNFSDERNPIHGYAVPGAYSWTLTVLVDGTSCHQEGTILVTADPPCTFSCDAHVPALASVDGAVYFSSETTVSLHCPGHPTSSWDFGDGEFSSEPAPSHAYGVAGFYRWGLTASDGGTVSSNEGSIIVLPPDGGVYVLIGTLSCGAGDTVRVPVALGRGGSRVGALGGTVSFDASGLSLLHVEPTRALRDMGYQTIWYKDGSGHIRFGLFSLSEGSTIPDGAVVYLTFEVGSEAAQPYPLHLSAGASNSSGVDLPVGSIDGLLIPERQSITATITWSGPGRAACAPPQNLEVTLNLPGDSNPSLRAHGYDGGPGGESEAEPSSSGFILVGYDLYRTTTENPDQYFKVNQDLIPASWPRFVDPDPPAGGVLYQAQAIYDTCRSDYSPPAFAEIPACAVGCSAAPDTTSGRAPLSVDFSAVVYPSTGCIGDTVYEWDFGDGATSKNKYAEHTYTSDGVFPWTFTASVGGFEVSRAGTVSVRGSCSLLCEAGVAPSAGTPPLSVAFTSAATPSDSCIGEIQYLWDFGDGGTARTRDATHTYTEMGNHTWTFTASCDGGTCSQSGVVRVTCASAAVTSVRRKREPFRLQVDAVGLEASYRVFVGGETIPWPDIAVKSPTRFIIKNAGLYFPRGDVWVEIRIENSSGCPLVFEYNWERNRWRVADR